MKIATYCSPDGHTQPVLRFGRVSGAAPRAYVLTAWWDNRAYDNWYLPYRLPDTLHGRCWGSGVIFRLKMPDGIPNIAG